MKDKHLFDCWKAYREWLGALYMRRNSLYSINYHAIKKSREELTDAEGEIKGHY